MHSLFVALSMGYIRLNVLFPLKFMSVGVTFPIITYKLELAAPVIQSDRKKESGEGE